MTSLAAMKAAVEGDCAGQLPTALTDVAFPLRVQFHGRLFAGKIDEAMLGILLPIPGGGNGGQVAQALHAVLERRHGALLLGQQFFELALMIAWPIFEKIMQQPG